MTNEHIKLKLWVDSFMRVLSTEPTAWSRENKSITSKESQMMTG